MSDVSSEEIYALLDSIESDHEEDIGNLMNNSDTQSFDYSLLVDRFSHKYIDHTIQDITVKSNLISKNLPRKSVVTQLQPDDDSKDEEPLCKISKTNNM